MPSCKRSASFAASPLCLPFAIFAMSETVILAGREALFGVQRDVE